MKKRNFWKYLAAVACIPVLAVAVLFLNGNARMSFDGAPAELSAWMGGISDAAPLNQLAIPGSHDAGTAGVDGLFVLQCQLTDGKLIFGPWARERAQDETMSAYIENLGSSEDIDILNVILRDFITPDKCRQIIDLNVQKGYMADQ